MTFRTQSVVKTTELLEDSWSYFLGSCPVDRKLPVCDDKEESWHLYFDS